MPTESPTEPQPASAESLASGIAGVINSALSVGAALARTAAAATAPGAGAPGPITSVETPLREIVQYSAEAAANFVRLVTVKRRLFFIRAMIADYRKLYDASRGVTHAEVTTAIALSDANLAALKDQLKAASGGRDVDLDVKLDPSIIGGLIVKLGSRMVDGSLRTKLNAIRLAMKEVG